MGVYEAIREATRCRAAVQSGSPKRFWIRRLKHRIVQLNDERAVLCAELDRLQNAEASSASEGGV